MQDGFKRNNFTENNHICLFNWKQQFIIIIGYLTSREKIFYQHLGSNPQPPNFCILIRPLAWSKVNKTIYRLYWKFLVTLVSKSINKTDIISQLNNFSQWTRQKKTKTLFCIILVLRIPYTILSSRRNSKRSKYFNKINVFIFFFQIKQNYYDLNSKTFK